MRLETPKKNEVEICTIASPCSHFHGGRYLRQVQQARSARQADASMFVRATRLTFGNAEVHAHENTAAYLLGACSEGADVIGKREVLPFASKQIPMYRSHTKSVAIRNAAGYIPEKLSSLDELRNLEAERDCFAVVQCVQVLHAHSGMRRLLVQDGFGNAIWVWSKPNANAFKWPVGFEENNEMWSAMDDVTGVFEIERYLLRENCSLKTLEGMWFVCRLRVTNVAVDGCYLPLVSMDAILNGRACTIVATSEECYPGFKSRSIVGQKPRILMLAPYEMYSRCSVRNLAWRNRIQDKLFHLLGSESMTLGGRKWEFVQVCERIEQSNVINHTTMIVQADLFDKFQKSSEGMLIYNPLQYPIVSISATHARHFNIHRVPELYFEATTAWLSYCDRFDLGKDTSPFIITKIDAPHKFQSASSAVQIITLPSKHALRADQSRQQFDLSGLSKQIPDLFMNIAQRLPYQAVSSVAKTCRAFALFIGSQLWHIPFHQEAKLLSSYDLEDPDITISIWHADPDSCLQKPDKRTLQVLRDLIMEQSRFYQCETLQSEATKPLRGVWLLGNSKLKGNSAQEITFRPELPEEDKMLTFKLCHVQFFNTMQSAKIEEFLRVKNLCVSLITQEMLANITTNVKFQMWRQTHEDLCSDLMPRKHQRLNLMSMTSSFVSVSKNQQDFSALRWLQPLSWTSDLQTLCGFCIANDTTVSYCSFITALLDWPRVKSDHDTFTSSPAYSEIDENACKMFWSSAERIQTVNAYAWMITKQEDKKTISSDTHFNALRAFELLLTNDIMPGIDFEQTKQEHCQHLHTFKNCLNAECQICCSKFLWFPRKTRSQKVTMNLVVRNYHHHACCFYVSQELDVNNVTSLQESFFGGLNKFSRMTCSGRHGDVLWLSDKQHCFGVNVTCEEINQVCKALGEQIKMSGEEIEIEVIKNRKQLLKHMVIKIDVEIPNGMSTNVDFPLVLENSHASKNARRALFCFKGGNIEIVDDRQLNNNNNIQLETEILTHDLMMWNVF